MKKSIGTSLVQAIAAVGDTQNDAEDAQLALAQHAISKVANGIPGLGYIKGGICIFV